jgi:hypothetical protein
VALRDCQEAALPDFQEVALRDCQEAALPDFQEVALRDCQEAALPDFQEASAMAALVNGVVAASRHGSARQAD